MPRKRKAEPDYGNRSDLQSAPAQPVTAAPDQAYGEAGSQRAAQTEMPLPNALAQQRSQYDSAVQAAQQTDFQPINIGQASSRPGEPITHGLSSGPGAGPEALRPWGSRASDVLQAMAENSDDPSLRWMADLARSKGR